MADGARSTGGELTADRLSADAELLATGILREMARIAPARR
jgi:hypothetical protein